MRKLRRADPELESRWLDQIREIATAVLAPYDVDLYLIGSRARGDARLASDIDFAIDSRETLSPSLLAQLSDEFEESTVPVRVEVIDLRRASAGFRAKVLREGIRWIASRSA
jgi:predicted nucleotidyltransferase